ncbi:18076_t:CDS:2 [Acaulospora morrowiae]|uniref:18076_t:CDS:1 n=1 Tax=Acaulospora morrowiae TaxID=94023 RepID=A0A9N8Z4K1_9GLOM|nr:18076_t:CDS:2 [Acaulospora morrowiae]
MIMKEKDVVVIKEPSTTHENQEKINEKKEKGLKGQCEPTLQPTCEIPIANNLTPMQDHKKIDDIETKPYGDKVVSKCHNPGP